MDTESPKLTCVSTMSLENIVTIINLMCAVRQLCLLTDLITRIAGYASAQSFFVDMSITHSIFKLRKLKL